MVNCLLLILLSAGISQAADVHCGASATGSGNGSDWNNQCDFDTVTMVRDNTYYIADGSYASRSFAITASGSTQIIVRKATAGEHGSETGWTSTLGDGQAAFGSFNFTTANWTIDGAVGGGPADWECTNCGFRFTGESGVGPACCSTTNLTNNILIEHSDITAGAAGPGDTRTLTIWDVDDLTIRNSAIRDSGCDLISGNQMNDFLVEYSYLARNHQAEPGCHGDVFEYQITTGTNFVFRYNFFEDIVGSYAFGAHGTPVTVNGYEIYGNIFYWTFETFFGNGLIGTIGDGTVTGMKFYNNTLAGAYTSSSGVMGCCGGTGNVTGETRNNIWWQSAGASYNPGLGGGTSSANTCYTGSTACQEDLSGNPFTNSGALDFSLVAASTAGTTLDSPYDEDMLGVARAVDTVWDRGAFEFNSGADGTPPVPGNSGTLTFSAVGVDTITVNWTEATDAVDAQNLLESTLFRSSTNNIDTVANMVANGTIVTGPTADIASGVSGSLSASTTYWYNVRVCDTSANCAAYTQNSQATDAAALSGSTGAFGFTGGAIQ